jgi:hypothetical protein
MPLLVKRVLLARLAELLHVTDIAKVVRRTIADRGHRSSNRFFNRFRSRPFETPSS